MTENVIVAIHQPNFFPWFGFFNKIARSNLFILMDNVQYPKTGGTWTNRVAIIIDGQKHWLTVPVIRSFHGTQLVREIQINNSTPWRQKMLKTIQVSYPQAPFFEEIFPVIDKLVNNQTSSLADFNVHSIQQIMNLLHMDASKLVLGSTLESNGKATDLLISMIKSVGGTSYLCGGGASSYQEDQLFDHAGIQLIYQNYQHPVYPQKNTKEFVPGLSIIDALMNVGPDEVAKRFVQ
jgi:hypothetical protein